jgi:hypothetical protein
MQALVDLIRAFSPDAQLILVLTFFALVLLASKSRSATRNFHTLLRAIGDLFHQQPKK